MPYIDQSRRDRLDPIVEELVLSIDDSSLDGSFNYVVTRLILGLFGKRGYSNFVRVAGNLEEIKAEYRRRVVEPYEDEERSQNGDVY